VARVLTALIDHSDLGLSFEQRELGRRLAGRLLREMSAIETTATEVRSP
jgi:hypothetical protein